MKKIVIAALTLLIMGSVYCQDTVRWDAFPRGYMQNSWMEPVISGWLYKTIDKMLYSAMNGGGRNEIYTQGFVTDSAVNVAGVAVSVIPSDYFATPANRAEFLSHVYDTTHDNIIEYVKMYQREGDSMYSRGNDILLWMKPENVTYYLDPDIMSYHGGMANPIPIYELFFDETQSMRDTFYVGITNDRAVPYDNGGMHYYDSCINMMYMTLVLYVKDEEVPFRNLMAGTLHNESTGEDEWIFSKSDRQTWLWILFPILGEAPAREEDSTSAIRVTNIVDRYTTVGPNPARGSIKVMSSFGLETLRVYGLTGQVVYEGKLNGLSATIDVSGWPNGEYVFEIATVMGQTTRKVMVMNGK